MNMFWCATVLICIGLQGYVSSYGEISQFGYMEYANEADAISTNLQSLQKDIQLLKSKRMESEKQYADAMNKLNNLNNIVSDLSQKQVNSSVIVAFSAYSEVNRPVNDNEVLVFTGVTTNIGNHYNASTGQFTCPYDGIYNFNIVIFSRIDRTLRIGVFKDTSLLIRIYSDWSDYDQSGQSIVVECLAGQVIYSVVHQNEGEVMELVGNRYATFSGVLLGLL